MIEFGWMATALILGCLAYRRVGRDERHEKRVQVLEMELSAWPTPDAVLERLDALEDQLASFKANDGTLPAVVARANDLTKDMLELKKLVAEHREILTLLRSKSSLRALGGLNEG